MFARKKEIPLGKANIMKLWGDASSRKSNKITGSIEWEQDMGGTMRPVLSISILSDEGQPILTTHDLESLADIPELAAQPSFGYMLTIAQKFTNGIKIGTKEQVDCVRRGFATGEYPSLDTNLFLKEHKKYLEKNNLLNVQLEDGTWYRYGQGICDGKPVTGIEQAIIKALMDWD